MGLIQRHRAEYGLNQCLGALGVSKGTWHHRQHSESGELEEAWLKEEVREVVREHPAYGYRRIGPELGARLGELINHKRLRRLLSQWGLALCRTVSRPRRSGVQRILQGERGGLNLVHGWTPGPLEMLSTDFTEIRYAGGTKKAQLMAMLDPASEWVPGWAVGASADRAVALQCWDRVQGQWRGLERDLAGVVVHHDLDPVYTSYAWLRKLLLGSGVLVSFSEHGARDNPWIESFWGRFKTENRSLLLEADTLAELEKRIGEQITYYNTKRRHSSLDYKAPEEYLRSRGIHVRPLSPN